MAGELLTSTRAIANVKESQPAIVSIRGSGVCRGPLTVTPRRSVVTKCFYVLTATTCMYMYLRCETWPEHLEGKDNLHIRRDVSGTEEADCLGRHPVWGMHN